jgi:alpha-galactosidase/6-phospho-beta-glucosidase family protein
MQNMRIVFIGGGSYQWVPTLFRDIAVHPVLQDCTFVLHDIHEGRNKELAEVCRILARKLRSPIHIETEPVLSDALLGADAAILCISTGGLDAMEADVDIPKRYGVFQPVGDSTGPGGISRTLRNVPVVTAIAREMERCCPDAWLLNLSNPMDQIVRAISLTSRIKVAGLCHEYMSFMGKVAGYFDLECWQDQTSAVIAGVNHFAWITELDIEGKDGLAMLRSHAWRKGSVAAKSQLVNLSENLSGEQVKFALFDLYGAMPYPGDRHLVEFFPNFLSEQNHYGAAYGVELTTIENRRINWLGHFQDRIREWTSGGDDSVPRKPSDESLAPILAALFGGEPTIQPVTLGNSGQVENLPRASAVETLATFSRNRMSPHASGALPEPIRALVHKHCLVQDITVEAALEGSREKALQAMVADPLNSLLDYRDIKQLLNELLEANRGLLPQFFNGAGEAPYDAIPEKQKSTERVASGGLEAIRISGLA